MVKSPASRRGLLRRGRWRAPAPSRASTPTSPSLRDEIPGDVETIEPRARRIVERMALALQASLLVRYGDAAVADAFCASRLSGDWGQAFGTLPAGTDFGRIIERHRAASRPSACSVAFAPPAPRTAGFLRRRRAARPTCSTVITPREAAVGVDRHQGAEAAQVLVGEQRVERGVVADWKRPSVALEQVGDVGGGAGDLGHLVGAVAVEQAEEAVGGVDDREPGPAVAQEVLVERLLDAELAGDRDRFAVHHVGDRSSLDLAGDRGLHRGAAGGAVDHHPDQRQPDAAEDVAAWRSAGGRRR